MSAIPSWLVPKAGFSITVWDRNFHKDDSKTYIYEVIDRTGDSVIFDSTYTFSYEDLEEKKEKGIDKLLEMEFLFLEDLKEGLSFTREEQGYMKENTAKYEVIGTSTRRMENFFQHSSNETNEPENEAPTRECWILKKTWVEACRGCRRNLENVDCEYCNNTKKMDVVQEILIDKELGLVLRKEGSENSKEIHFIHNCYELHIVK